MPKVSRLATLALNEAQRTAAHVRLANENTLAFVSHARRCGEVLSRIRDRLGADHFRMWIATQPELSDALADEYIRFSEDLPTGDSLRTLLLAMSGIASRL